MNKQAAKLAKTTALLNSTSIQLRISGLIKTPAATQRAIFLSP
jgi:hypothetical protein